MSEEIEIEVMPDGSSAGGNAREQRRRGAPELPEHHAWRLQQLEKMARMMDSAFELPVLKVRVGLDSIIGLIPIAGDLLTGGYSLYVVHQARQMGLPRHKLARMVANIGIDLAAGLVPLAGDVLDVYIKANLKNVNIIRKHFGLAPLTRKPLKKNV